MKNKNQLSITLSNEIIEKLKKESNEKGISLSSLLEMKLRDIYKK